MTGFCYGQQPIPERTDSVKRIVIFVGTDQDVRVKEVEH